MPLRKQLSALARLSNARASSSLRSVLYVDRAVIVLNKPSGLVAQTSLKLTQLLIILPDLQHEYDLSTPPYPVHRLDKNTTGALVLAKTTHAARELSRQFKSRAVIKDYLALVRGGENMFTKKEGVITNPIQVDRDGRVSVSTQDGKPALTTWELLGSSPRVPLSLLRMQLHTGLKHQLRVHTASVLKAPILGDTLHGAEAIAPKVSSLVPEECMFLHASSVSLFRYRREGPSKRFRLKVVAPLPISFIRVCRDVGIELEEAIIQGGVYMDDVRVESGEVHTKEVRNRITGYE
ncbi:hypothetical protein HETIRDRAFT_45339 [Heterobasidion irregulare TC 32-1]|uniref:Pseudouridine synthase RsuA/RluA-like domain-containing protein n=1 Tax=Heterobasidion irregulare (strain TC 32-1) TaxID=747525 RepID=W4K4J8_HETIT|nr:uncharacterized protein HETIRDRAFT_45339 [Heterobasidion irregulare TC 32-1]ETW80737.1 hypothetical protein HETIRDRAFT_45339 [Heterobasidion irregulare TC 32-1]